MANAPVMLMIPLVSDLLVTTTGGGANSEVKLVLEISEILRLGPQIKQVRGVWAVEGAATDLRLKVRGRWSARGLEWSPPSDLSLTFDASADGTQKVDPTWITDTTKFGPFLRPELWAWNGTVGAALSGRVWAWLQVQMVT